MELAALGGAHVIASVGSPARAEGPAGLGADEVVVGLDGVDRPVDLILDTAGGPRLAAAWQLLAPGGNVQNIGWASDEPAVFEPYSLTDAARALLDRRLHRHPEAPQVTVGGGAGRAGDGVPWDGDENGVVLVDVIEGTAGVHRRDETGGGIFWTGDVMTVHDKMIISHSRDHVREPKVSWPLDKVPAMVEAVAPVGRTGVARAWAEALTRIRAGDVPGTEHYISTLSPAQRAEIAAELPGHVARAPGLGCAATPLLLAGAGCLSEPAEVASWLFKPELQADRDEPPRKDERSRGERTESRRLLALLRRRPPQWQADVARHITSRLRLPELRHWEVAAELTRETGIRPPRDHAFIVGWLRSSRSSPLGSLANDPLSAAYAPHLLDFGGLTHAELWLLIAAVTRLVEDGLLTRASVLGTLLHKLTQECGSAPARPINARSARPACGTSARFTHPISGPMAATGRIERRPRFGEWPLPDEARGPRAGRLTSAHLVGLHDRLNPALDEAAAHASDYASLLPAGPVAVADMAVAQLWRLEEAGRLDDGLLAEAMAALTSRPEKKLLRVAVEWAAEAALRDATRTDIVLQALVPVLAQDTPALRERAARLALSLAPKAGPRGRAALRRVAEWSGASRERLPPPRGGITPL